MSPLKKSGQILKYEIKIEKIIQNDIKSKNKKIKIDK